MIFVLLRRHKKQNEKAAIEPEQKVATATDVAPPKKQKQTATKKPSAK